LKTKEFERPRSSRPRRWRPWPRRTRRVAHT